MLINRDEVLIVLHFYQVTGFGCIGAQNNRTIQRSEYTLIGIGSYICSVGCEVIEVRLYFSASSY